MNTFVKQAGLPEPAYEEIGSNFVVTFKKAKSQDRGGLNGGLSGGLFDGLNEGLKSLYMAVVQNPGKQAKELSDLLSRPINTLDKQIKKLVERNLIKRRGSKKTGGYWIIESNDENKD